MIDPNIIEGFDKIVQLAKDSFRGRVIRGTVLITESSHKQRHDMTQHRLCTSELPQCAFHWEVSASRDLASCC